MLKHFTGTHDHRMDDKGRVSLPTEFRRVLDAVESPNVLYLIPDLTQQDCLACLSTAGYEKLIARFNETEYTDPEDAARDELKIFGHATQIQIDPTGRIVITKALRDTYRLEKAIRFVGAGWRFEIWRPETRDAYDARTLGSAAGKPVSFKLHGLHG